jgi:hypothetical protein
LKPSLRFKRSLDQLKTGAAAQMLAASPEVQTCCSQEDSIVELESRFCPPAPVGL